MDRKTKKPSSLERLRDRIDAVDAELVALLNKRAGYAVEIAAIKREANLPFHSPEREKAVLERIS
ncbi:MAG: chorismate mutase, partial [Nitrospirales bacterium]|nr:chorismate mutase [Nitrospirales bacterium]